MEAPTWRNGWRWKKKELSNINGLHFVSKRIYPKKKLGDPVLLLLESE